jgi:hypothetical protein
MEKWQFPELLERSLCPRDPPITVLTLQSYALIQSRFSRDSRITQYWFTGPKKLALPKISFQSAKYLLHVVYKTSKSKNVKIAPLICSFNVS